MIKLLLTCAFFLFFNTGAHAQLTHDGARFSGAAARMTINYATAVKINVFIVNCIYYHSDCKELDKLGIDSKRLKSDTKYYNDITTNLSNNYIEPAQEVQELAEPVVGGLLEHQFKRSGKDWGKAWKRYKQNK